MMIIEGNAVRKCLSRDAIKLFAVFAMTLNHIAHIFMLPGSILYTVCIDIGYFTAITMCYFLVEGYEYTRDLRKYIGRLAVFALISQIPFYLAFHAAAFDGRVQILNMLFSLLLSLLILLLDDSTLPQGQKAFLMLLCYIVSCFCDWPGMAAAFTLLFKRMKTRPNGVRNAYLICIAFFAVSSAANGIDSGLALGQAVLSAIAACGGLALSGLVITGLYDGREGKHPLAAKWFFYLYYPLHLLILVCIREIII